MPKSYDATTAELSMTLSTVAYVDENRIASQQQMISEINAGLDEAQVLEGRTPTMSSQASIFRHRPACQAVSGCIPRYHSPSKLKPRLIPGTHLVTWPTLIWRAEHGE
jgi:hypothetical protein